ncbi:MAG: META domain-containing protein [Rhodobacterales bacterium]|nr:META domain-containing protein [Rhodobacterales bacterium]
MVVLSGAFGQVGEVRSTSDAQVPLPFLITTEDTSALTVRAALFSGGAQIWLTAEVPVPEGADNVDLGALALLRHVPLGFASSMKCGDRLIDVGFAGETARLRIGGRVIELAPVEAASGAKYGDGAGNGFWSRGNRATVTLDGVDLAECLPVITPTLPLVARGNEPGWVVTLAHEGVVYSGQDGTKREAPLPAGAEVDGATVFDTGEGLAVSVTDQLCRDTMTGMPHPYTVGLTLDGQALSGCGGAPADLLAGVWKLVDLPGLTVPEGVEPTFEVAGDFMSGASGCNRYMGGLALSGEGLSLQPGGMSMMACEEPLMQFEAAFVERLGRVSGFDIDEAGQLILLVDGAPGAVFAR